MTDKELYGSTPFEIFNRLMLDKEYVSKAKKSICIDCENNLGFGREFYLCSQGHFVRVEYRKEGVFHTEIIKCDKYGKQKEKEKRN